MWTQRQSKAYWLEAIIPVTAEDWNEEYADGYVEFGYLSLIEKKREVSLNGVETEQIERTLETRSDLPFKQNDKIRIGNHLQDTVRDNVFRIESVDIVIPKEFEKTVAMFPKLKGRYAIKRLMLK